MKNGIEKSIILNEYEETDNTTTRGFEFNVGTFLFLTRYKHIKPTEKFTLAAFNKQIIDFNRQTVGLILIFAAYLC